MRLTDAQLRELVDKAGDRLPYSYIESMATELLVHRSGFLGKKVWVAERQGDGQYPKITLHRTAIDALTSGAEMMAEVYGKEGNACEGDDPTEFKTIHNYGGIVGLTKIIFVRPVDSFFPGDPDVSVYEKEVK